MLNHITIMGRLLNDPELRYTQTNVHVCMFRLAVDRDFKDKETGERKADFINVVAWRNTAEFISRNFSKGRMAVVDGRLQIRDYEDRDGNRRTVAEVVANNVYFGDSRPAEAGHNEHNKPNEPDEPNEPDGNTFEPIDEDDGELPFN